MPIHRHLLGAHPVGNKRVFAAIADKTLGATSCSVHENVLAAGEVVPLHSHAVEEVIVCLEGSAECSFDGAPAQPYDAGDVVIVPPRVPHTIRNTGAGELRQLAFFAAADAGTQWSAPEGGVDSGCRTPSASIAQETLLSLFYGRWRSQTIYAGLKLGVFDLIGSQPMAAETVARELGLVPSPAYRLLRALRSLALLDEDDAQAFSLSPSGALLTRQHPLSMRDAFLLREGPEHTAVWKHLPTIVQDGGPNGFIREYGVSAFDYATSVRSYGDAFDAGMSSQSNLQTQWALEALQGCELDSIAHVCDVGGGRGHLLCHLLAAYPAMRGTLLDRPSVIDGVSTQWMQAMNVLERCTMTAGDMFIDVPAADAYAMKMILHDWSDDECICLLETVRRRAVGPARLFIVEHVIRDAGTPDYAALFDMHMLCWGGGRERGLAEYRSLLAASGWRFERIRFAACGGMGVIEARAESPQRQVANAP